MVFIFQSNRCGKERCSYYLYKVDTRSSSKWLLFFSYIVLTVVLRYRCVMYAITIQSQKGKETCSRKSLLMHTHNVALCIKQTMRKQYTIEKTERTIKNEQSRDTGNIGHTRHKPKIIKPK